MERPPLERWRDRPPGPGLEDLAGERLREVQVPELSEVQLARVARRINDAIETPAQRWRSMGLRWAFLTVFLGSTVTAGAAIVGVQVVRSVRLAEAHRQAAKASPSTHSSRGAPSPAPTEPAPVPELPSAVPPAVPEEPPVQVATPEEVPPSRHETPAHHSTATTGLTAESRVLHEALEQLNVRGDATSALARLDGYRASYPNGVLAREADVARVDALLRLGRDSEALGVLDVAAQRGFEGYPRPGTLRVLRGELLARLGRCGEAIPIFTSALADPQAGQSAERALYGRASCRATLGESTASRADLSRYLELYPQGHFASEARRALSR